MDPFGCGFLLFGGTPVWVVLKRSQEGKQNLIVSTFMLFYSKFWGGLAPILVKTNQQDTVAIVGDSDSYSGKHPNLAVWFVTKGTSL